MHLPFLFYNLFIIPLLYSLFKILAFFNKKIKRGIIGREKLFSRLASQLDKCKNRQGTILVHAASMGEFEQARPVLRALRQQFPGYTICASVFSPSAFDNIQNNKEADIITYLPFDTLSASRKFLNLIKPRALLFTRYDLWPNLVWEAKRQNIFTMLFDASVQKASLRHKPLVRQFSRSVFLDLNAICAISQEAVTQMQALLPREAKIIVPGV